MSAPIKYIAHERWNSMYRNTEVYVDRKLKYMPYAEAGVRIHEDSSISLVSFATTVITIDSDGFLTSHGIYGKCTGRHITAFLREYAPQITYNIVKLSWKEHFAINIETGETKDLKWGD